jgi:FkbM family methyltransferase
MVEKRGNCDLGRYINAASLDETWLDIGAHIGIFTVPLAAKVKKVIAFEADPENFELLKMNTAHLPNVEVYQQAVIGTNQSTVKFGRTDSRTMGHVARSNRGNFIEVPAINFNSLITQDVCIKMDIEGGERDILDHLTDWSRIQRFVLEFHSNALHDHRTGHAYCKHTLARFRQNFASVETDFKPEKQHWAWNIYGDRVRIHKTE